MGFLEWLGHVLKGQVDYQILVFMGGAAIAGNFYGARLTGHVSLGRLLMTMGWVLLMLVVLLAWYALRS